MLSQMTRFAFCGSGSLPEQPRTHQRGQSDAAETLRGAAEEGAAGVGAD
jgi:hypothetical protein